MGIIILVDSFRLKNLAFLLFFFFFEVRFKIDRFSFSFDNFGNLLSKIWDFFCSWGVNEGGRHFCPKKWGKKCSFKLMCFLFFLVFGICFQSFGKFL